jgi:hypothetical protein
MEGSLSAHGEPAEELLKGGRPVPLAPQFETGRPLALCVTPTRADALSAGTQCTS